MRREYTVKKESNHVLIMRKGFSMWAFLLTWMWLLRHRLYVQAIAVFGISLLIAGSSVVISDFNMEVGLLFNLFASFTLAIYVGLKAYTWRTKTWYSNTSVIQASSKKEAIWRTAWGRATKVALQQ